MRIARIAVASFLAVSSCVSFGNGVASAGQVCWGSPIKRELTGGLTNNRYARHSHFYYACSSNAKTIDQVQWADFDVRTLNIVGSMFMSANKDGNFSGITGNFSTVGSSKADVYVTVGIPGTSFGAKVHYRNTMFSQVNADGGGLASSKGSSYWVWA